jgi:hypothetical protein
LTACGVGTGTFPASPLPTLLSRWSVMVVFSVCVAPVDRR